MLSRLQALRALGLGTADFGLAACGGSSRGGTAASSASASATSSASASAAAGLTEIPGETAGCYPMTLELTISDLAKGGAPFAGMAVYVWHCAAQVVVVGDALDVQGEPALLRGPGQVGKPAARG